MHRGNTSRGASFPFLFLLCDRRLGFETIRRTYGTATSSPLRSGSAHLTVVAPLRTSREQKRLLTRERNRLHGRHRAPLGAGRLE